MANVEDFVEKQMDTWTGQKLYAPDLLMPGQKKWKNTDNHFLSSPTIL